MKKLQRSNAMHATTLDAMQQAEKRCVASPMVHPHEVAYSPPSPLKAWALFVAFIYLGHHAYYMLFSSPNRPITDAAGQEAKEKSTSEVPPSSPMHSTTSGVVTTPQPKQTNKSWSGHGQGEKRRQK
jgi:hypothetical protein